MPRQSKKRKEKENEKKFHNEANKSYMWSAVWAWYIRDSSFCVDQHVTEF